ncbi:MAG: alpha/beta hydrolase [Acidimicrobiales bacterium]|jgi:pimeloyl-ACP methyl ester carboxylesterase|nr:alpha/beta hydrolase [Acidimicrobiales bacterium]
MTDAVERIPYDEFALFHENAREYGLPYEGPPTVRRAFVAVEGGRRLSALVWGDGDPELVLLHGGAQNAHTWDTVALALDRPLVAVDLPGHGHSDGPRTSVVDVAANADDVAAVIRELAPEARAVVGMSLGGITTLALVRRAPELVRAVVLVDITPGVNETKASAITSFVNGPERFASFEDLLERTIAFNPTRTEASLRRGILHNALQLDDGSWVWRYARHRGGEPFTGDHPDFGALWDTLSEVEVPLLLARGMTAQSVVDDADEVELRRRVPHAQVVHVEGAGHSIQGDKPVELAALIAGFLA